MLRYVLHAGLCVAILAIAGGCDLDREAKVRAELSPWLKLQDTQYFRSRASCTVAVFGLSSVNISSGSSIGLDNAFSISRAIKMIEDGNGVLFAMRGKSPTRLSEMLMSRNLARGIGLLSSGVGPVMSCAEEPEIKQAIYDTMIASWARLIYIPAGNAIVLVDTRRKTAFFLRGNV